ncbi:serine/threonine protein kinase [Chthoniobacter flavus Ellin428]|uniref:Serine/threonine protein kinase n=1 Tax=Chthoniobacter flavus Ellin428 TaxID=497964 RepID=B4DCR1_9BACT|nr:protein kinase [Chthoniobacter flavus]EDY15774.1 serine/threonine protein kinase [Chthoniobacter flavus Ellin428]TCO89269.1 serine/threonine protein kinase [Chthoniobacter flavus]
MIASEHRLALPAGYQLGKYRFKGVLGAGGFGITYLAEDHSLGRRVAIKELLPNDIATRLDGTTVIAKTKGEEGNLMWARERFLDEGRALAACEHPNVVHVYEMVEANGTAYMVTKYEDGRSLAEWLTTLGRKPTEGELRGLLDPLLSGLEKVHRAGFLHRDIKPENIYITEDGRPILLDFGSARQAVNERSALLTSIVTIGYAPFEQYYEDGKQGAWSDIYALGGVMYRAIHGDKPPEATRRLKTDTCARLAKQYASSYSGQFLSAIDKALAVEYKDRPQSVAAWRTLLGNAEGAKSKRLSGPPLPIPQGTLLDRVRRAAGMVFDYPRMAASAAAVGVLFCAWVIMKMISPTPHPQPDPKPAPAPFSVVTPPPVFKGAPSPAPGPIAYTTPVPAPVATPSPEAAPQGSIIDPGLVGTWTTKVKMGGTNYMILHWEQFADGHYSSSVAGGPIIDAGMVTAQGGVIHRESSVTHINADFGYEIRNKDEIVTNDPNDPNGPATWKRLSSGTASKEKSGGSTHSRSSSNNNSGDSSSHPGSTNWQQYIPRNIPFHGPRPF